jgi:6-phosphogluconolactonase (cycloisomerase 2 family)
MKKIVSLCVLLAAVVAWGCKHYATLDTRDKDNKQAALYLLVGSYASASQPGVKLYRFQEDKGEATYLYGMKGIEKPSYLAPSIEGSRIYAVGENSGSAASVHSLFFDKENERLTQLNSQPAGGSDPCHVALNPSCQFVVTANYSGANISVFSLDIDGKLRPEPRQIDFVGHGPVADRQLTSHPHCITFTPDHHYLLVNDLGADRIHVFPLSLDVMNGSSHTLLDEDGQKEVKLEPGSGPRHIAFHPNGRYAYLLNELAGTVTVFNYNDGNFWKKQTVEADANHAGGAADIHVSPDGKFVYASVRLKDDGICIFRVDSENGQLTKVGYQTTGAHPRNFVISPDGRYLLVACRDANCVQIFEVDKQTGSLTDTGRKLQTNKPSCLQFVR